ncbi:outer membrane protein assembly factor BamA [candidate division KSB1 bacterium]|nr:outer membrane protein assembly factor BamA [candidate division KSB1 bacterium]
MLVFNHRHFFLIAFIAYLLGLHALGAGADWRINKIIIVGNTRLNEAAIRNVLLTKESRWYAKQRYTPQLFQDDLDAIIALYHNFGHIDARILTTHVRPDSAKRSVDLFIFIFEGETYKIESLAFLDNQKYSSNALASKIKSKPGKAFSKQQFEKDAEMLLRFYALSGYINTQIEPSWIENDTTRQVSLTFAISEGKQVSINSIHITGLKKLQPHVIERICRFKSGELFNINKIEKTRQSIMSLGLFRDVIIKPGPPDSTCLEKRDIIIVLSEKENGEINLGVGFGSEDQLRGSLEILQNSFMGTIKQAGLKAKASFIHQGIECSYTDKWFFSNKNRFDANLFLFRTVEPNYTIAQAGGRLVFGHQFAKSTQLTFAYKYQDVKLSNIEGVPRLSRSKGSLRSLLFNLVHDSRDNLFSTTKGIYSNLEFQSAGGFLQGSNTFIKLQLDQRVYLPVTKKLVIAAALKNGMIKNFGDFSDVPLYERFYAGGVGSIRGFKKREVGPHSTTGAPTGGVYLFISTLEFRYLVYRNWGGILFGDAGNVWQDYSLIHSKDLRYCYGVGLGYLSRFVTARIDFGFKLHQRTNESWGEVHFTLGQSI